MINKILERWYTMQNKKTKNSYIKTIFLLSGAIIAFHIGSGFASGQEIMQFFTSYGISQSIWGLFISFLLFSSTAFFVFYRFNQYKNTQVKDCYNILCTKYAAMIFSKAVPVLLFFIYTVMLAGTGEAIKDFFNIPSYVGRIVMGVAVLFTVAKGLNKVVDIISQLGFLIIILVFILGVFGFMNNPAGVLCDYTSVLSATKKATPNFILSAILYSGFSVVTGTVFFSGLATKIKDTKQSIFIALVGNGGFIITALVLNLALLANLPQLVGMQIPALYLTRLIGEKLSFLFIAILFAGAYSTSVPMLWSIIFGLETSDKRKWYTLFCVMLTLVSIVLGNLPFDVLLGAIYPCIGTIGVCLFLNMFFKWIFDN